MKFIHTQKNLRSTPRKLRKVVDMVRGKDPKELLEVLPHVRKKAANGVYKALKTAIANAESRGATDDLILESIQVNEGPKLKRWRAGARGTAKPYSRRWSHLRIVLETKEEIKKKKSKKIQTKKGGVKSAGLKKESKGRGKTKTKKVNIKAKRTITRKVPQGDK